MRARKMLCALGTVLGVGCTSPSPEERALDPVTTVLLHTSDLHSRVWPARARISDFEGELGLGRAASLAETGGLAHLATLLDAERARAPDAVWLDSGDALEGGEIFQRFAGRAEIELLGALGLSAMTVGNHELSLSAEQLAARADEARFPLLAANLSASPASPLAGRLATSCLLRAGPIWLGVIGVAHPRSPPRLAELDNPWQLEVASDAASAVQSAVDQLASRAQLIVVLSHLGIDGDRELVRGTSGVDVVLGGHQHLVTREAEWIDDCDAPGLRSERGCRARRVPIVHSGAYGKWLSRLDLQLRPGDSGYEIAELGLVRSAATADVPASPRLLELLEPLQLPPEPPLAFILRRIPRGATLGGDAPLGNLTTDAVQRATDADVVLMNTSGLRAELEAGPVLRSELEQAFPFAEPWRRGLVPSEVLRRGLARAALASAARDCTSTLQVAGLALRVRCGSCPGSACSEASRDGRPLADHQPLVVVLPEYIATPGAAFEELFGLTERVDVDVIRALERHFAAYPRGGGTPCEAALRELSPLRCRSAFGLQGCPVPAARARAFCDGLPRVEGRRDARIEMLP